MVEQLYLVRFLFSERSGLLVEQIQISLEEERSDPPIRFAPGFVNYKKGALDSQPQVIKFTSCLPMVDGSLRVLLLLPPLKLVAMILHLHCCVAYLEMSIHLLT
jgi:hypothetical protein